MENGQRASQKNATAGFTATLTPIGVGAALMAVSRPVFRPLLAVTIAIPIALVYSLWQSEFIKFRPLIWAGIGVVLEIVFLALMSNTLADARNRESESALGQAIADRLDHHVESARILRTFYIARTPKGYDFADPTHGEQWEAAVCNEFKTQQRPQLCADFLYGLQPFRSRDDQRRDYIIARLDERVGRLREMRPRLAGR